MKTTIEEFKKLNEEANFPAQFAIDDSVSFVPMFKHQQLYGISEDQLEGKVTAVRFSKAKVFYDIVDEYYGKLFDEVDSGNVSPIKVLQLKESNKINEASVNTADGKFTFKTEKPTGKYRSFGKNNNNILLTRKLVGLIDPDNFKIRLMIVKDDINSDGNPNCIWKWITLSKNSETLEDAQKFLNDNINAIIMKYTLYKSD